MIAGRTWEKAFEFLFKKYPPPLPEREAALLILQAYQKALERDLPVVPGSVDAVRAIAKRYPLALVSGSHRKQIEFALKKTGLTSEFRFYLGAEDYPRSKPAPDGYLKALELLGVPGSGALVFEDSEPGIESALAAGTRVIAITGTNHFHQSIERAHSRIPDLRGIDANWIEKLWPTL
jgi:HAD superfamily hydrolase (TIGR01509 family)